MIVAEGLRFPEAPVAMPDGSIVLGEIESGWISRVTPDGTVQKVVETGGGPNGLAVGPDSALYCCNNGGLSHRLDRAARLIPHNAPADWQGGSIQRVDLSSGSVETLYTAAAGVGLRGPNDIVFDAHGGFWFTDRGKSFARARDCTGVFYALADGSGIDEVIFPLENPNGIGLSPDGNTLLVAETYTCMLWAFDVTAPGSVDLASKRLLYRPEGAKWFDSLGIEAGGNICVATMSSSCRPTISSPPIYAGADRT